LSDTEQISLNTLKDWLERETSAIFVPVHEKARALTDEMRKTLVNLLDASKMLLDNSGKEIEKRNMKTYGRARALNKLARLFLDRLKKIEVPEKVTYNSFSDLVQETQKAFLVTEVDVRNWFPRISPFFILDRRKFLTVFEKSKELLKEMHNFLTKEYVKTKTLEETFELIETAKTFENQLLNLKEQKSKIEMEKASIEKEIAETNKKIAELENKGSISQLNQAASEIDTLNIEVKHHLQHLQKPFIKLQAMSLHGGGSGLTLEEVNKITQYLENPFEALATEDANYPILRQILQKLAHSICEGKLKLKPDKMRKAEQAIDNILNKNILASLHQKCAETLTRKRHLLNSSDIAETKNDILRLKEIIEKLERRKDALESEEKTLERSFREILEKIHDTKSRIEKNIFSFMNRKVHVE